MSNFGFGGAIGEHLSAQMEAMFKAPPVQTSKGKPEAPTSPNERQQPTESQLLTERANDA